MSRGEGHGARWGCPFRIEEDEQKMDGYAVGSWVDATPLMNGFGLGLGRRGLRWPGWFGTSACTVHTMGAVAWFWRKSKSHSALRSSFLMRRNAEGRSTEVVSCTKLQPCNLS